jgi:hypothetical protein
VRVKDQAMDVADPRPPPGADALPEALSGWAPEIARTFVLLGADVALVVDASGVETAAAGALPPPQPAEAWVGQQWIEAADAGSRPKARQLLDEALGSGKSRRHELNPVSPSGTAPLAWYAVRLGNAGLVLAVGRSLGSQVALQQQFLQAQQALENSYWQAQRRLPFDTGGERPLMTARERHSLGLAPSPHLDDLGGDAAEALQQALDRLHERIGKDNLQSLLRDARRVAEQQFLQRALARAGSVDALARALGVSRRALLRRGGAALRTMKT